MKEIIKSRKTLDNNNDLRGFIRLLRKENSLIIIRKTVDPKFQISAIASTMENSRAIMFENVKYSKIRVACNILSSRRVFSLAIRARNQELLHSYVIDAMKRASEPKKLFTKAPFEENSSKNLSTLPIVTHFEKDAGAYITSSIVFAKDRESGNQNASTHRLLRLDDRNLAIRMVEGRHLHKCFLYSKELGEDLKVSIVIGVHPAISIAAAYQAAYGVDEMMLANSLLHGNLTLTKSSYSQLFIPACSEIVLDGRILKDRTEEEWMVEMLRTYDLKRRQPVFELERIRFRNNAILHDILPGFAEHRLLMGLPVEAKMFEAIKNAVPTTIAVHLTEGGCNWLAAVIQIHKRLEGDPKNALLAAFASHPSLKMATVVDADIDPVDPIAVEYAVCTRCQADRGLVIIPNTKGSSLDPSSDQQNLLTTKLGIDATATLFKPRERFEIARIPGVKKHLQSSPNRQNSKGSY